MAMDYYFKNDKHKSLKFGCQMGYRPKKHCKIILLSYMVEIKLRPRKNYKGGAKLVRT